MTDGRPRPWLVWLTDAAWRWSRGDWATLRRAMPQEWANGLRVVAVSDQGPLSEVRGLPVWPSDWLRHPISRLIPSDASGAAVVVQNGPLAESVWLGGLRMAQWGTVLVHSTHSDRPPRRVAVGVLPRLGSGWWSDDINQQRARAFFGAGREWAK